LIFNWLDKKRLVLQRLVAILLAMVLCSCGSQSLFQTNAAAKKDSAPLYQVDPATIKDAIPREDVITRAGNKNPYTVLGKTYYLLPTGKNYAEEGIASWYGTKFHGLPTANGEPYSLYAMTAAHRTLPIPAYVKVTNLDNQRTAIVRVNDRGPFHSDRIIDLSYAAAVKLGYDKQGTARVRVEAIDTSASTPEQFVQKKAEQYFLQVGAFKNAASAHAMKAELSSVLNQNVVINPSADPAITSDVFYRVQVGPLAQLSEANLLSEQLQALGKGQPRIIVEELP
jgi:rare lipoprotein A